MRAAILATLAVLGFGAFIGALILLAYVAGAEGSAWIALGAFIVYVWILVFIAFKED